MHRSWLVSLVLLLVLYTSQPVGAYPKALSPEPIREAIEYGKSRKGKAIVERGHPNLLVHYPSSTPGGALAIIGRRDMDVFAMFITPWLRIALASQEAAAQFRELTQTDIDNLLQNTSGKITVMVEVFAALPRGYWETSHAVIIQDGSVTQPVSKETRLSNVRCKTSSCDYFATVTVVFPDERLRAEGDAEFAVNVSGGAIEKRFPISFGAMR